MQLGSAQKFGVAEEYKKSMGHSELSPSLLQDTQAALGKHTRGGGLASAG